MATVQEILAMGSSQSANNPYASYLSTAGRAQWDYGGQSASNLGLRTRSFDEIQAAGEWDTPLDYGWQESTGTPLYSSAQTRPDGWGYAWDDQNGIRWRVDQNGYIIPGSHESQRSNQDFSRGVQLLIGGMAGAAATGYGAGGAAAAGGAEAGAAGAGTAGTAGASGIAPIAASSGTIPEVAALGSTTGGGVTAGQAAAGASTLGSFGDGTDAGAGGSGVQQGGAGSFLGGGMGSDLGGNTAGGNDIWGRALQYLSQGNLRDYTNLLSGLYGMYTARQVRDEMDPFREQRGYYGARLRELEENPGLIRERPGYRAGIDSINREMASRGYLGGGNQAVGLMRFTGDFTNQELNRLATLAGAGTAPGAGMPGYTNLMNSSLASIGYGLAPFSGNNRPRTGGSYYGGGYTNPTEDPAGTNRP